MLRAVDQQIHASVCFCLPFTIQVKADKDSGNLQRLQQASRGVTQATAKLVASTKSGKSQIEETGETQSQSLAINGLFPIPPRCCQTLGWWRPCLVTIKRQEEEACAHHHGLMFTLQLLELTSFVSGPVNESKTSSYPAVMVLLVKLEPHRH